MFIRYGVLLTALLVAFTISCTSIPEVPVATGSRVLVRLYDGKSHLELVLANKSHPDLQGIYSRKRADANLKLAPDQLMGQLLASLDRSGLADYGIVSAGEPASGAFLLVTHDDQTRVFERPDQTATLEARQAYNRMKLVMDLYYSKVGSLQYVENEEGAALLQNQ